MKKIFKYDLSFDKSQTVKLPIHHDVLSAKNQNGKLVLYAIVDETKQLCELPISVILTGQKFEHEIFESHRHFIDTVFFNEGEFVVHVFVG